MDRVTAFNAEAQIHNAPLKPVPTAEPLDAYETRLEKWEEKHLICCNAIRSTLGVNYYYGHKMASNACFLWIALKEACKPKGTQATIALNDRYRRLLALKLIDFKDASHYAGTFKELHSEICSIHESLRLDENFLIFLFHTGLGKEHEDYVLHYTQNHTAIDVMGQPAFSLKYATQRFIQTVSNPSASRIESSLGTMVARPEASMATNGPVTFFSTIPSQPGAVEGPNAVFVRRLVKFCQHCQKLYHSQYECKRKHSNTSKQRKRSRSHSPSRDDRRSKRPRNDRESTRSHRKDRQEKKTRRNQHYTHPAYYDTSDESGTDECYMTE